MTTKEKTDNVPETKEKTDNVPETNNQSTFKPLGKYAAIAVIMVSIIVTTAIMLDKQLNNVEIELAANESEVAILNNTETDSLVESDSETKTEQNAMVAVEPEVNATQELPANTQDITTAVAVENTPSNDTQANPVQNKTEQKTNDRIAAYKLEQKQRMTDRYARIKTLEAKQLEQFKSNQDKQVAQLRTRVSHQEQLIEGLIARNNEWFELRTANVQRNQARREDILNRI
jgi:hypothetical protein